MPYLYLLQVLIISIVLVILTRRAHWILHLQILAWFSAVSVIRVIYGSAGSLSFYSNDQIFYVDVVQSLTSGTLNPDLDWWLSSSKFPFTICAAVVASAGVDPSLALKTVALIFLLLLTTDVLDFSVSKRGIDVAKQAYITATGAIGVFYSTLALRETMMMYLAFRFVYSASAGTKAGSLFLLYFLRPHLAISLALGAVAVQIYRLKSVRRTITQIHIVLTAALCVLIGYGLYSIGIWFRGDAAGYFGHQWGIEPVTRIASNFVGLQFLTAKSETVEFPLQILILLRFLLSETIIIPSLFTLLILVNPKTLRLNSLTILIAFSVYIGLVTNTEFNSFRQNIPLMTLMGCGILEIISDLRKAPAQSASAKLRQDFRAGTDE